MYSSLLDENDHDDMWDLFTCLYIMDRYHPDKNASNPEASELFKEVAYSYSILSDPEKRRQYDSAGFEVPFFSFLCESRALFSLLLCFSFQMQKKKKNLCHWRNPGYLILA